MSKKQFRSQASSARVAATTGFGTFGSTSSFGSHSSALSYVYEAPDYSAVSDPNVAVVLRNLTKKDPTTKTKALEDLQAHLTTQSTAATESALLTVWAVLYPRLSIDPARRVRTLAHAVTGRIASIAGKTITPHLTAIIPPWLAGCHDSDRAASQSAKDALALTFPSIEKLKGVRRVFHHAVVTYSIDAITNESVDTLSDQRVVKSDDAQATYARVVATSIALLTQLCANSDADQLTSCTHQYSDLLSSDKLWSFGAYNDVIVRRSFFAFARQSAITFPDIMQVNAIRISSALVDKALHTEQTSTAKDLLQTLQQIGSRVPQIWTTAYSGRKTPIQRLSSFVEKGSQSTSGEYWQSLKVLVSSMPLTEVISDMSQVNGFIAAIRKGVTSVDERHNVERAFDAYREIIDILLDPTQIPSLSSDDILTITHEAFLPFFEQFIFQDPSTSRYLVRTSAAGRCIARTVHSKHLSGLLAERWPQYTAKIIEMLKMSAPAQSSDFEKSQSAVAMAGSRLAELQGNFLVGSDNVLEELRNVLTAQTRILLSTAFDVLETRSYKPYAAANIVHQLVKHSSVLVEQDPQTLSLLHEHLLMTNPDSFASPSAASLTELIYQLPRDEKFTQIWSHVVEILGKGHGDAQETQAFEQFLAAAFVKTAADPTKSSPVVQKFMQSKANTLTSDRPSEFIMQIFRHAPEVMTTETMDVLLSKLLGSLNSADSSASALNTLGSIVESDSTLIKSWSSSTQGKELLPTLISLEASADDTIADKTHQVASQVLAAVDIAEAQASIVDTIRRDVLDTAEKAHPISVLVDMSQRLIKKSGSDILLASLIPDMDIWHDALIAVMSRRPPVSMSIMGDLQGVIPLVNQNSTPPMAVLYDRQGYSRALRIAVFVTMLLTTSDAVSRITGQQLARLVHHLGLTTLLLRDSISLFGANDVCIKRPNEGSRDLSRCADQMDSYVNSIISQEDKTDPTTEQSVGVMATQLCLNSRNIESAGIDVDEYYNLRVYALFEGVRVSIQHPDSAAKHTAAERILTSRESPVRVMTELTIYRDVLGLEGDLKPFVNELVARLTEDDLTNPHETLVTLLIFNAATQGQSLSSRVVANQRLVFLVKHLLTGLERTTSDQHIRSETFRALRTLAKAIHEVYGEHWTMMLEEITRFWSTISSDASKGIDEDIPSLYATLQLYGTLTTLGKSQETNDDLADALAVSQESVTKGLIALLLRHQHVADQHNEPLRLINELTARFLETSSTQSKDDASIVFPLLIAPSAAIQRAALCTLRAHVHANQEQISFDAALEKKAAHLPEELLSLMLEVPNVNEDFMELDSEEPRLDLQGYLFSWLLVFEHFNGASYQVKTDYISDLKSGDYIRPLLDLTYSILGLTKGRTVDVSGFDIAHYLPGSAATQRKDLQWLLTHLYYSALSHVPNITKAHYLSIKSRQTSLAVATWSSRYISPLVVNAALESVSTWSKTAKDDPEYRDFEVKVSMRSREVNVSYVVDEQTMAIKVQLPESYPLEPVTVTGARAVVEETRWTSWLRSCQGVITFSVSHPLTFVEMITNTRQNGNLIDGLSQWRKNVIGALKGQTECAICYSIVSGDKSLPSKKCGTCKNSFHSSCLYKWFKTSNASTCPLCRNPFNYG